MLLVIGFYQKLIGTGPWLWIKYSTRRTILLCILSLLLMHTKHNFCFSAGNIFSNISKLLKRGFDVLIISLSVGGVFT